MSDIHLLIASDIFGRTQALEQLAQALPVKSTIVDPYKGKYLSFADEQQAYSFFSQSVGLEQYQQILADAVAATSTRLMLLGFSIGASAIWQVSDKTQHKHIEKAWGFYGSQIRHQTDLTPGFELELILPASEQHFDVQALVSALAHKAKLTLQPSRFLHGFMNRHSGNFDSMGYQEYLHYLATEIQDVK